MATMVEVMGNGRHGAAAVMHREGEKVRGVSVAKNIALFFAAPFVGLAYIVVFPVVGTVALLRYGARALL